MVSKSRQKKLTAAEIKVQIQRIQKAVEQHKRESECEHFISITPEAIKEKFNRINSPMIVSQGWNPNTVPGGTVIYNLGIFNPDPTPANVFAQVWVGSGNIDSLVSTFLLNVDTRFPRLTQPDVFGLKLPPGASSVLRFRLTMPPTLEKTSYIGNSCLMKLNSFDVGKYLDRGSFVFTIT